MKIIVGFLLLFFISPAWAVDMKLSSEDSPGSVILIRTDREGLFGFLGHKHAVIAKKWKADLSIVPDQLEKAHITVVIDSASLQADEPTARERAGFKDKGPGEHDRGEIQKTMQGPSVLDSARFPQISFESSEFVVLENKSDYKKLNVKGKLHIRDQSKPLEVIVEVRPLPDGSFHVECRQSVRQSDFGITPFSKGGLVKVKDVIEFQADWKISLPTMP